MNVRPSREVTRYSHRHGVATSRALRRAWPLARVDALRLTAAAALVGLVGAGCSALRHSTGLRRSLQLTDIDVNGAITLADGSAGRALALWTSALGSPWWAGTALVLLAARRLRRWQSWRSPLLLVGPAVIAAFGVTASHLVAAGWGSGSAPASPHATGAVLIGGGIGISELVPSRRQTVALASTATAVVAAVCWGRMATGTDSLSSVAQGVLIGVAAVSTAWWVVSRACNHHLERSLERELGQWRTQT